MLQGITTTIIKGARGIGVKAGHGTSDQHVRITLGSRVLQYYPNTYRGDPVQTIRVVLGLCSLYGAN